MRLCSAPEIVRGTNSDVISTSAHTSHFTISPAFCLPTHIKHGFGLFGQGHVVYPDGKAEGICEEDGSVHGVHRTVPDVEQCSCVVKAQIAARRDYKPSVT